MKLGPLPPKPMLTYSAILSPHSVVSAWTAGVKYSSFNLCLLHRKGLNKGGKVRIKEK